MLINRKNYATFIVTLRLRFLWNKSRAQQNKDMFNYTKMCYVVKIFYHNLFSLSKI